MLSQVEHASRCMHYRQSLPCEIDLLMWRFNSNIHKAAMQRRVTHVKAWWDL